MPPQLLEQRLKASKILAPVAGEEDAGYVPLPLHFLATIWEMPFDVFVKAKTRKHSDSQFVLCCARGQVLQRAWQVKLQKLGIPWVYVSQADQERVLGFLNHHLEIALGDEKLSNKEKAAITYEITLFWLRHSFARKRERVGEQMDLALDYLDDLWEILHREKSQRSFVTDLWQHDQGLYGHCLNICLMGLAFVNFLGWKATDARDFGLIALLHDIGMTLVPKEILRKPAPLSKEEWEIIKRHPQTGFRLLRNYSGLRKEALLAVLQHHESGDGSGYPDGLVMEQIHPWARIMRILDSYEAITADRRWRPARGPKDALWVMRDDWETSQAYDVTYLQFFIKFLGGL